MNGRKISISVIWLIFAGLFFILAKNHFDESKQAMPELKVKVPSEGIKLVLGGSDYRDFVLKFNEYVTNQNKLNQKANLNACRGYCLAGFTALFAMGLEWWEYIFAFLAKLFLLAKKLMTSRDSK